MTHTTKSITIWHKLRSVKGEIQFAFFLSVLSIFIIETFLKNYPAPNQFLYVIGDIYLKICYSIVATSIFFLINQHLPKENRNVKTNLFIQNRLVRVGNELTNLLQKLNLDIQNLDITEEAIQLACKNINPSLPVVEYYNTFPNWREYLLYKTNKINRLLRDVLTLNSSIETELLTHIVNMLDALEYFDDLDNKNVGLGDNLNNYYYGIIYLWEEDSMIRKLIRTGKYQIYLNTNMNDYENTRNKKSNKSI